MTNAPRDLSQFVDNLGLNISEGNALDSEDIVAIIEWGNDKKSALSWLLGDITLCARDHHNDDWINYLSHKINLRTLNNYASICRQFPRERRHAKLSFSHHDAVKGLEPYEQDEWLDKAEKQEMNRDELRDAIKDVAKIEKRTVIGHVGSIDKLLRLDMGLPENFEVKIVYEVVLEQAA